MIVYGISNCDTVRKARRWLDQQQIDYRFHDLRADGIDADTVQQWCQLVSWEQLLNRRSTTWRQLDENATAAVDQPRAVELMVSHPTLIKRPVLVTDTGIEIGFKAARYAELFNVDE
ncbi:MAG TPA: ArsC family reductase [Gammaproteobacteria bacterium]|nr:ArsC family reductase [Gammaproteobacteria bacterium]